MRGPHERERCEFAKRAGCLGPPAGLEVHQWSGYLCGFNSFDNAMDWSSQADASDPKRRALKLSMERIMLKAKSASQPSTKLDTIGFLRDEGDSDKMEPTQKGGSEFDTIYRSVSSCFPQFSI